MLPTTKYMGYRAQDQTTPYAYFYQDITAVATPEAERALDTGAAPAGSLPPVEGAVGLAQLGYMALETGYTLETDGSARVAVLTPMPGVAPFMWDWWFGWHGSHDNRYKLWHPKAHRSAVWQDRGQQWGYIGRVSQIEEYIGTALERANIRFVNPSELGFSKNQLADPAQTVFICARLGYTRLPLDFGWLIHQIRATPAGAEMRSRFWMGGPYIQIRGNNWVASQLSALLRRLYRVREAQARDLLRHCSEEMQHLASFLPDLYAQEHK